MDRPKTWSELNEVLFAGSWNPALQRFLKRALSTGRSGLPVESVGDVVWEALTTRRPRTFYPIMRNRLTAWTIPLALPARFLDRLIARRLGLSFRASEASRGISKRPD